MKVTVVLPVPDVGKGDDQQAFLLSLLAALEKAGYPIGELELEWQR